MGIVLEGENGLVGLAGELLPCFGDLLLCRAALFIQRSLDLGLSSRAGLVEPLIALVAGHLNRGGDVAARFVDRLLGVVPRACGTVDARLSRLHRLRQRFEEEILQNEHERKHERTNDEGCKVDGYQALSLIGENDRTELLTITRGFEGRQRFAQPPTLCSGAYCYLVEEIICILSLRASRGSAFFDIAHCPSNRAPSWTTRDSHSMVHSARAVG